MKRLIALFIVVLCARSASATEIRTKALTVVFPETWNAEVRANDSVTLTSANGKTVITLTAQAATRGRSPDTLPSSFEKAAPKPATSPPRPTVPTRLPSRAKTRVVKPRRKAASASRSKTARGSSRRSSRTAIRPKRNAFFARFVIIDGRRCVFRAEAFPLQKERAFTKLFVRERPFLLPRDPRRNPPFPGKNRNFRELSVKWKQTAAAASRLFVFRGALC